MRKMFPNEFKFFPQTWCWPVEASELRQYVQSKTQKRMQLATDKRKQKDPIKEPPMSPRTDRNPTADNTNSSLANKSTDAEMGNWSS